MPIKDYMLPPANIKELRERMRREIDAVKASRQPKPHERDMSASELSAFLEDIHQRYDAGREYE